MAVYIDGLVVEISPAFETGFDAVHDGAVPMADAIVILIPQRDLVVRQEAVMVLALRLGFSRW